MFESLEGKNIVVVAPDKYRGIARKVAHELSKLENCNAVYWSIKHYSDTEAGFSSENWVVSIGNDSENSITKDFLNFIDLRLTDGGMHYGYDGNKAVIFAKDVGLSKEEFAQIIEEHNLVDNNKQLFTGPITGDTPSLLSLLILIPFVKLVAWPMVIAWGGISNKKLKKLATAISADLFFIKGEAGRWLEIEE
ncbi:hypothetical protein [Alkalihalophilus marmarensis]|uniref:hypothetical protein n=1 Tax=Alkalihalophilus marmarensis TaxID=521377 RepID=UPI002E239B16|nr:hypothetical protein [Alkalihalophilus marmarensis]